jgi:hypothetical protein
VLGGVLAATFLYPSCVDKAVEIGNRILRAKGIRHRIHDGDRGKQGCAAEIANETRARSV